MKAFSTRVALLCLLFLAASAHAQQEYHVDVTNDTGYTILFLNVSPESTDEWEEDVLGDEVIMDGDTFRIELTGYSNPKFDIRAIDEDGDTYTFFGINVEEDDLTITLADLDVPE